MNPAATIVIPLRRQHDGWLEQCVRSALNQTAPCETIVVHAADTPASNLALIERLAQDHAQLRAICEERPGSFPGAINLGIRCARADRVGLLLSDDWLEADTVSECLAPDADIVSTCNTVFHADGVTVLESACANLTSERYRSLATLQARASYLQHFFLFRRSALIEVGGLDESIGNFPGIDDYDLIWTLLERGATVAIVEKRLYNYRDHDGERLTLADASQAVRNLEVILRKHNIAESDIPALIRKAARWYGKPMYRVLAAER